MTEIKKQVLVEYVGVCVNRPDDVLKTGRVWKKRGDFIAVPEDEAPHYLAHPGEWRAISPTDAEVRQQSRVMVAAAMERIKADWGPMTSSDLLELRGEVDARIAEVKDRETEEMSRPAPKPATTPAADTGMQSDDEFTRNAAKEKIAKIAKVLENMDRKDEDEWTRTGPRLPVVRERLGADVNKAEVTLALAMLDQTGKF